MLYIHAKLDFAWLVRDTRFALLAVVSDFIANLSSFGSIWLLAWQFDGVGNMDKYEVLFMLGYLIVVNSLLDTFGGQNNFFISRIIGRGQLEHVLIMPVSVKVFLLTSGFIPFTGGFFGILTGIGAMGWALSVLQIQVGFWWLLRTCVHLVLSAAVIICVNYLFAVMAFYAPVAAEEINMYSNELIRDLGKYPLSGMPGQIAGLLLTAFPAGLLAWLPARLLLGRADIGKGYLIIAGVTAVLFFITKYLFKKGFQYYVKTGSNRYLPYGFRG